MSLVLFCGGSRDGRWHDVGMEVKTIEVDIPPEQRYDWNGPVKVEHESKREQYRIWEITLLGYHMRVAALANRSYESQDVLRALVQRDVADHLTKGRVTR